MTHCSRLPAVTLLIALFSTFTAAVFGHVTQREHARVVPGVLEKSVAKYAALKSYSDSGTIKLEYGSDPSDPSVDKYTFTTFYRSPRQYLFDFKKGPNADDERLVIWADGAEFNTWWSTTKSHNTYAKGEGANAFALTSYPTSGSAMQIAPLLFSGAGLHGSISDFKLTRNGPDDTIGGHRCYKLIGEVALAYGTGAVTDARATTIWIDADSLLIRQVLEDSSNGAGVDRITTTFDPEADPKIDDAKFKFVPPSGN